MEYTWIRNPTPVTINSIRLPSWSTLNENAIFRFPETIHENKRADRGAPSFTRTVNTVTDNTNDSRTARLAIIPDNCRDNLLNPNPVTRKPSRGKRGISQNACMYNWANVR